MISENVGRLVDLAIKEDLGSGDITTQSLIPQDAEGAAFLLAKEPLVVCGNEVAEEVFRRLDKTVRYCASAPDGAHAAAGSMVAQIHGRLHAILAGERTALNFMQRLSAIATKTRHLAALVEPSGVLILDTRKTTPGLRELEKYAVRTGGGVNHRQGLFDAVLIKNNHIDAVGGDVRLAARLCRERAGSGVKIEVEVRNQAELDAALDARPDVILLDNFSSEQLKCTVKYVRQERRSDVQLEASGGINEGNLVDYAVPGLTYISMGSLTHSVQAMDIALRLGARPLT